MQREKFPVYGVIWDGSTFSAISQRGIITGTGSLTYNLAQTGGKIVGTLASDNKNLNRKSVEIEFEGGDGTCTFLS